MKQITVISGKGGTGKTVLTAAFATLAKSKVMADCDVDASDLHLLLHPQIKETHDFRGGMKAMLDAEKCTGCGECLRVCRFDAISEESQNDGGHPKVIIDSIACEGCQVCALVCPTKAIRMQENVAGQWYLSDTRYGPMVHARLGIAQENSGKLVAEVRKQAQKLAIEKDNDLIISDGPPGIGCPVISSLSGTDLALLVTEPTLSGQHDLERVIEVCRHFEVPALVCINKCDINADNKRHIREYCHEKGLEIAGEIPYDNKVTEAMVRGKTVVEFCSDGSARNIRQIWQKVGNRLID